jgi:predicted HTH transcriptional regulator
MREERKLMPKQMALDVDPLMDEMLELFQQEGNLTTGALVDWTGKSRATVTKRLDKLRAADHIAYVHSPTGLHRLTSDPREDA